MIIEFPSTTSPFTSIMNLPIKSINWNPKAIESWTKKEELPRKKKARPTVNGNKHLMPPPLKRESWSLEDMTMFGVAGGAGWPSEEEEAVIATAEVAAAAVSGSTGSEFEIILPSPRSHFSSFFFLFPLSYFAIFSFLGPLIFKEALKKAQISLKEEKAQLF